MAGQAENIHRATDLAKRLNIPLVWLVNCSGIKLPDQHYSYAGRRSGGATFFRHAELQKYGVPILAAIYGTNPAGGGYHSISPTVLFAHKDANMAVGGAGIVSGMSPKGYFDEEACQSLIDATKKLKSTPPGRVEIHHDATGFFRYVYDTEYGVLDGIHQYMAEMPAYGARFFQVAEPRPPLLPPRTSTASSPSTRSAPTTSRKCWRGSWTVPSRWSSGRTTGRRSTAASARWTASRWE